MIRTLFGALLIVILSTMAVCAQPYRDSLMLPPVQIIQSMQSILEQGQYEKLPGAFSFLVPLAEALGKKEEIDFVNDIQASIQSKSRAKLTYHLQRLVIADISDLLSFVKDPYPLEDKQRSHVRIAVIEYNVISSQIQVSAFQTDQKVKNNLKRMSILLENSGSPDEIKRYGAAVLQDLRPLAGLK